jgi:8-oxo-dGTP pyrophosphatase MutT (NUDIX family)
MTVLWSSRWLSVESQPPLDPYIRAQDEVLLIAVDPEDRLLLIEEPCPAFGGTTLILPGGCIEEGETTVDAGHRELREETNLGAASLVTLGRLRPWPKYLQVYSHVVFATGLRDDPLDGDETYEIGLHYRTRAEVRSMIEGGELDDARTIAALAICPWWTERY